MNWIAAYQANVAARHQRERQSPAPVALQAITTCGIGS